VLKLAIPGFGRLRIEHLVLDYNGTLALDGRLLPGVKRRLKALSAKLRIHVVTADTFGRARVALRDVRCGLLVLPKGSQARAKAAYVRRLGAARTACIGNGRNDRLMLRVAALGIGVVQSEGAAPGSLRAADLVIGDVREALDLLLRPMRLLATLRD
jgi:soluble P-type ATPase